MWRSEKDKEQDNDRKNLLPHQESPSFFSWLFRGNKSSKQDSKSSSTKTIDLGIKNNNNYSNNRSGSTPARNPSPTKRAATSQKDNVNLSNSRKTPTDNISTADSAGNDDATIDADANTLDNIARISAKNSDIHSTCRSVKYPARQIVPDSLGSSPETVALQNSPLRASRKIIPIKQGINLSSGGTNTHNSLSSTSGTQEANTSRAAKIGLEGSPKPSPRYSGKYNEGNPPAYLS
jgi:hypothetical protein